MPDDVPLLEMEDIAVHFEQSGSLFNPFASPDRVRAVDGISLTLEENDVLALVGESGCGKTTLGKVAVALQKPTRGSVRYRGQDIWESKKRGADIPYEDIRRALQIIHQDPGSSLNPNQKVRRSLALPLKQWYPELSRLDREARIHGLLEAVEMTPPEDYANRYPHQLSGGEKQRVALVRALLMNPDVILADESVSALDVSLRVEMMDLFLELQDLFDTSFIFISHDLSNARYFTEKVGGQIAIMYLGDIVEVGAPEKIINDPDHPYTQALRWATPSLRGGRDRDELPLRKIDVPDPIDPPSGCKFHTRCPEARVYCSRESPPLYENGATATACYRVVDDHEYWDSEELSDEGRAI